MFSIIIIFINIISFSYKIKLKTEMIYIKNYIITGFPILEVNLDWISDVRSKLL